MEALFSREIQAGLDMARLEGMKKSSRLRVRAGDDTVPVVRMWKSGFAMEAGTATLRGLVDLYDGTNHLFQCLIVKSEEEAGESRYEFKRATAVAHAPAIDFERADDAPVGLIENFTPTADR